MLFHSLVRSQIVKCATVNPSAAPQPGDPKSMLEIAEKELSSFAIDGPIQVLSEPGTYYGFTAGACTGFALKKIAKAAAFTFGAVFVGFQLAAQTGYLAVNWDKVEHDIRKYLPEKRTSESEMVDDAVTYLTTNTGIAAGVFTAGFVTGLRMG